MFIVNAVLLECSPWYSSYSGSFKQMECFRIVYEPLLYQYGVDVIFNGHGQSASGAYTKGFRV